jgi:hypothetical protein
MQHARQSSGVYPGGYNGSNEGLHGNAAPVAGYGAADESYPTGTTVSSRDPQKDLPFYRRRKFLISQAIIIPLGIILLFVLLFPVVKAIAQAAINNSSLDIQSSEIRDPSNSSFTLAMKGLVTGTGAIPATISFPDPVDVTWVADYGSDKEREVHLGTMNLPDLEASNGQASIDAVTQFNIDDTAAFGEFSKVMINDQQFTWRLKSNSLKAQALKFPQATGLSFSKDVTIKGINKFAGGVKLKDFKLPATDPKGGIKFTAVTELNNPSPFTIDLGTVVFGFYFQNVFMGEGRGPNTKLVPGTNEITLGGRLISHEGNQKNLDSLGVLFTKFLNGESVPVQAKGVSTLQANGQEIGWLSEGVQALTIDVPFVSPVSITPIRDISIGYLNLTFTPETAWSPMTASDKLSAKLSLPFGFDVSISEISNTFSIMHNNLTVGSISTPLGASSSDIRVKSTELTEGTININLAPSPLQVTTEARSLFSKFDANLTALGHSDFQLVGHSRAVSKLPIGTITLDPIKFNVPSGLNGLQGLNGMASIDSVDVTGGTPEYMSLAIGVSINNPSNLNLNTGDVDLQLFKDGGLIGTVLLPNLNLVQGKNTIQSVSKFTPNNNRQGLETLAQFVDKKDTKITISGYDSSTKVASLVEAFKGLKTDVSLPGMKESLIQSTSMTVLPTTSATNNIVHAKVVIANPFTADLTITKVTSTIKSHGLTLGTIDQSVTFPLPGKQQSTSPDLNLALNMDTATLLTLLKRLATDAGMPTDQLDAIVAIGGFSYLARKRDADLAPAVVRRGAFDGFDLVSYTDQAFQKLTADISIISAVNVGQYPTSLAFSQSGIPVATDASLHLLLPIIATPIVQKLVGGAVLQVSSVIISDAAQNSFTAQMKGSITNAGPFDADLNFGSGLTISWNGKPFGTLKMPPVSLKGDVGGAIDVSAPFVVSDVDQLTAFTKELLSGPSFTWTISGADITVNALGISVPKITMTKDVVLKGMNGLKGGVVINSFDLPSNDPAGGIHLTLQTTVTNPSQVGIALSSIGFNSFVPGTGTFLGPVAGTNVVLTPGGSSSLALAGRLVPQTTAQGLKDVSQIFTDFVHGKDSNLIVQGSSAGSPDITWLNAGISALQIATVLPAVKDLQVIKSITLNDMSLVFSDDKPFAPLTSSTDTSATFGLPFAFPLDIVALQETITIGFKGTNMATLALPKGAAVTNVETRTLKTTFSNVPFAVIAGQEAVFQDFLKGATTSASQTFHMSGSANTDAQTAIGLLSISDIPFSLDTTIAAINSFGGSAVLSDIKITGSGGKNGNEFVVAPLKTTLKNPSHISLLSSGISLPAFSNGVQIGSAVINPLKVAPGDNIVATEFRYGPANANDTIAQKFLQNFLQGTDVQPVEIQGSTGSTTVTSLQPALAALKLTAGMQGIGAKMVSQVNVYIGAQSLITNLVTVDFDLVNPLDSDLVIEFVQNDSGIDGDIYAHFEHKFPSLVVPAKGKINSGPVHNVLLTKGTLNSLGLIPRGILDLAIAITARVGPGGYQIPWLNYQQASVPTKYNLDLLTTGPNDPGRPWPDE